MLSCFSRVQFFVTLRTVVLQAPLPVGSRQEDWGGLPCSPPGDLPDPGIEPTSPMAPALQADSLLLRHEGSLKTIHGITLILYKIQQIYIKIWYSTNTSFLCDFRWHFPYIFCSFLHFSNVYQKCIWLLSFAFYNYTWSSWILQQQAWYVHVHG